MNENANNRILVDTFGAEKRWVAWRLVQRAGQKKPTKPPFQITGEPAESDNPATWSTYAEVKNVSDKIGLQFGLDGMLLGIDLDHWLTKGEVKENKKALLTTLLTAANSYTEISPSEEGLHIFLKLSAPCPLIAHKKEDKDGTAVEVYAERRFFTVTERAYGTPKTVRTVKPFEALEIISCLGYPWGKDEKDKEPQNTLNWENVSGQNEYTPSDFEVLEKMFASKMGEKIKALYHGGITDYNNDDSAADMAFVSHLAFWCSGDKLMIERLWLNSPLGRREKTNKRKDYRDRTIATALKGNKDFYTWRKTETSGTSGTSGTNDQAEQAKTQTPPFIHLSDFVKKEFPPVHFVLEPFFETNAINMVSAPPNNWKSWFLLDVALAIGEGKEWVGTFKTEKQRVLIVNEEDTESSLQLRVFALGAKESVSDVYFYVMSGYKVSEKNAQVLISMCAKERITLIMFDSFRSIHNAKENDSTEMQTVMDHLKLFTRAGITVVFTHHHKKKPLKDEKVDDAEATRGSTAINAAVSGHISLEEEKREEGLFLVVKHLKSKATKKREPFELRIHDEKGIRFEYGKEHVSFFYASQMARAKVLKTLEEKKDKWFSVTELVSAVGMSETNVRAAIRELVDKSYIHVSTGTKIGIGGRGNVKYYRYRLLDEQKKEDDPYADVIFKYEKRIT